MDELKQKIKKTKDEVELVKSLGKLARALSDIKARSEIVKIEEETEVEIMKAKKEAEKNSAMIDDAIAALKKGDVEAFMEAIENEEKK